MLTDLKTALRGLLRERRILLPAVASLALGIGANVALTGFLDDLLFRPPSQVRSPESVVRLFFQQPGEPPQSEVSYPIYLDLMGQVDSFERLAAWTQFEGSLGRGGAARKARIGLATATLLPLFGVAPVLGRTFSPDECDPRSPSQVALVSWDRWQRDFGGRRDAIGRSLAIGKLTYTIVGVLPRGFSGLDLEPIDVWLPIGSFGPLRAGVGWPSDRYNSFLHLVARLRSGRSTAMAAREATQVHRRVYAEQGDRRAGERFILLGSASTGASPSRALDVRLAGWLAGMSVLVWLIACANVSSLLIVRALERRRGLALRIAVGAGRARVIGFLLSESLLLAVMGGVAALGVARMVTSLLRAPLLSQAAAPVADLDPRRLAILLASTMGAGILSGVTPAILGLRACPLALLQADSAASTPRRSRTRATLLVAQTALTFACLVGAGLFVSSLLRARSLRLGFEPDRVLLATYDLRGFGASPPEIDALYHRALERLRQLPGVESAGLAAGIPFRSSFGTALAVPGRGDYSTVAPGGIYYDAVGEGLFETLGTSILLGRSLKESDATGTERVAVVNATMATLLWPNQDPLGRCFKVPTESAPCTTVVGVVEDARRNQLQELPTMQFYLPLAQAPELASRALFLRPTGAPGRLVEPARRAMQGVAAGLPYAEVTGLSELVAPRIRPWRLGARVFSLLSLVALVLSAVGIFAALNHAVAARSRELGICKALGAPLSLLVGRVLATSVGLASLGIGLGWVGASLAARKIEPLLFAVSSQAPGIYVGVASVLALTALLAGLSAARRVARLEATVVLRSE